MLWGKLLLLLLGLFGVALLIRLLGLARKSQRRSDDTDRQASDRFRARLRPGESGRNRRA